MARNILIGLGAGLAAALLFAGLISGTVLAFPLFLISPLPIAIAGLSFGTWSGATAAALASALIAFAIGPFAGLLYFILFAGPTAWTAHLVGLSRGGDGSPETREWFPLDAILFRIALVSAAGVVICGFLLGYDPTVLVDQTVGVLESWLAQGGGTDIPSRDEIEPLVRFNILLMPVTTACVSLGILILNNWLGARIARLSGQFHRPWTPLWTISLQRLAGPVFGIAVVAAFLPGPPGQIAGVLAGAMGFAFALTGFGCLHAFLRGRPAKVVVLFVAYAISFVFVLPVVLLAILGVADTVFQFRARRLAGDGRVS